MSRTPRCSSALEALRKRSANEGPPGFHTSNFVNLERRRLLEANDVHDGWEWNNIIKQLSTVSGEKLVDDFIPQLLKTAGNLLGPESSLKDQKSLIVFLLKSLRGKSFLTESQRLQLRRFCPADWQEESVSYAIGLCYKLSQSSHFEWSQLDESNVKEYFGSKIKVTPMDFINYDSIEVLSSDESEKEDIDLKDYEEPLNDAKNDVPAPTQNQTQANDDWFGKRLHDSFGAVDLSELGLSIQEIQQTVFDMLMSSKSNEQLQEELFNLLGFERFSLIEWLLGARHQIAVIRERQKVALEKPAVVPTRRPAYGCQVTIQSEKEKRLKKEALKDARKNRASAALTERRYEEETRKPILREVIPSVTQPKYPFVFDSRRDKPYSFGAAAKICLPEGTEVRQTNEWEEMYIPPETGEIPSKAKETVTINSLGILAESVFSGVKTLNCIQSVVCPCALGSHENMLICAPTGAGKTFIAILSMLHEIAQHCDGLNLRKDEQFLMVYIAPMKSLCAEMVENFSKRFSHLGIKVREVTGDVPATRAELAAAHLIIATPEKWDVVTRRSDHALPVRLIILDEVHLLHEGRGAVLESLVARSLRQVETTQTLLRLVGLSATLPNYVDVARFLRVNPMKGLFFFDGRFRPVPLSQTLIGVKSHTGGALVQSAVMDDVCFEKVDSLARRGHQSLVFVHSRSGTFKTALALKDRASQDDNLAHYKPRNDVSMKPKSRELQLLMPFGFAIHHAGLLRSDRNLVEKLFRSGQIKVLVTTATLAWGVNLPARGVIIRGTRYYDPSKSAFVGIGILDILQMFGRAGRPQYDKQGEAHLITEHPSLAEYARLLGRQTPVESQYKDSLVDCLNAEIVLGTVTSVSEAVRWLSYTFLYVRMRISPHIYGVSYGSAQKDPDLVNYRETLIIKAARELDRLQMVRYHEPTGYLYPTSLGRTASHFYLRHNTVEIINERLQPHMSFQQLLCLFSDAQEFAQMKLREEEMKELEEWTYDSEYEVSPVVTSTSDKVNLLLQSYISQRSIQTFSLVSDIAYIAQNAGCVARALHEIARNKGWPNLTLKLLTFSKCIERRLWPSDHILRQLDEILSVDVLYKLQERNISLDRLRDMKAEEIGALVRMPLAGKTIKRAMAYLPSVKVTATALQPITRTVLRVTLSLLPEFHWNDRIHGLVSEPFWLWVEDPENDYIYHSELIQIHRRAVQTRSEQVIELTVPLSEPLPGQYYVQLVSDRWLGIQSTEILSFRKLILPTEYLPHTDLLDLQPLPTSVLNDAAFVSIFSFTHFNAIQTQIFHTMFHTDLNALIGAPTGSGKTVAAELAMLRVFKQRPECKCVYIAPLKAVVRERLNDWRKRLEPCGWNVLELSGDVTPDSAAIARAHVIVTTPEKWDGISRSWSTRGYVRQVALIVIDEVHMLGESRGPILEVIVSRANFISAHTKANLRLVALSTALANAGDVAAWLNVKPSGLFNFRSSVRPIPLQVHIAGVPGRHYCPRMAAMNRPTFKAIQTHSPKHPVLVFVSSRRQTRLTSMDLIALQAYEVSPGSKPWLHMSEEALEYEISTVQDPALKLSLEFGIGLHHAGLSDHDRSLTERLFLGQHIQILVATATLAWGVNLPAHLVIVKGTEFYDGATKRYKDMPLTDVLQMIGRAGRPSFDPDVGVALVLVAEEKKAFYKRFLYQPYPVESSLSSVLADHINAEIVAGTVQNKQAAVDYLTWTYLFRRLVTNPAYYGLASADKETLCGYLSTLVENSLRALSHSGCIIETEESNLQAETPGRIIAYYYLSHKTALLFGQRLSANIDYPEIFQLIADAEEYSEFPVRHNEELQNAELSKLVPFPVPEHSMDSPHRKVELLLQAHCTRSPLPCSDYALDTKSVLDQSSRIIQAALDWVADNGWLPTALRLIHTLQMLTQARWITNSPLLQLPGIDDTALAAISRNKISTQLPVWIKHGPNWVRKVLASRVPNVDRVVEVIRGLPRFRISMSITGWWESDHKTINVGEKPVQIHADQEYVLRVTLKGSSGKSVYAPKHHKSNRPGWIIVIGEVSSKELIALKRVGSGSHNLAFYSPDEAGPAVYTVYVMSDCYLGLDQQYDIKIDALPPSIEAQLNTEVSLDT